MYWKRSYCCKLFTVEWSQETSFTMSETSYRYKQSLFEIILCTKKKKVLSLIYNLSPVKQFKFFLTIKLVVAL